MNTTSKIAGLALALLALWPMAGASAQPNLGALSTLSRQAPPLVEPVWGRHRSCEWGDLGWHRHVGANFRRLPCDPSRQGRRREFRDWQSYGYGYGYGYAEPRRRFRRIEAYERPYRPYRPAPSCTTRRVCTDLDPWGYEQRCRLQEICE